MSVRMKLGLMEEVHDKYYGSVLCKHESEIRERAVQGRKVVGSLERIMKERTVSMEVEKRMNNGIIVSTTTYVSETWVWNGSQRSRMQGEEINYQRKACERKDNGW